MFHGFWEKSTFVLIYDFSWFFVARNRETPCAKWPPNVQQFRTTLGGGCTFRTEYSPAPKHQICCCTVCSGTALQRKSIAKQNANVNPPTLVTTPRLNHSAVEQWAINRTSLIRCQRSVIIEQKKPQEGILLFERWRRVAKQHPTRGRNLSSNDWQEKTCPVCPPKN